MMITPQILRVLNKQPSIKFSGGWPLKVSGMKHEKMRSLQKHVASKLKKSQLGDTPKPPRFHIALLKIYVHVRLEELPWKLPKKNCKMPFLRLPTVMATTPMVSETARERGRTQLTWKAQLYRAIQWPRTRKKLEAPSEVVGETTPFSRLWEDQQTLLKILNNLFFLKGNHSGERQVHQRTACKVLVQGNHRFSTRESQRLGNLIESGGWAQRRQTVQKFVLPNRKRNVILFHCFQTMSSSG